MISIESVMQMASNPKIGRKHIKRVMRYMCVDLCLVQNAQIN